MSPEIICLGEMLVEIMRAKVGVPHIVPGLYKGPYPSGAPCIFIDSAARMAKNKDLSTGFIGVVGDDDFGRALTQKLEKDGVDISQVRVDSEDTTGIAFVQYNEDGSRKFIFSRGAAGKTSPNDINEEYFSNIKCLHIMGSALSISESSKEACYKAIKIAREQNPEVEISFDPNLRPEMMPIEEIIEICKPVLDATTILLPSGEEAEMLAQEKGADNACKRLLSMNPKIVILKRGKDGSRAYTSDGIVNTNSFKVEEIDPTGAGDSFGGAFIVGYLNNVPLEENLRFANAVGALKVTSFGPMSDHTIQDIEKLLR
ncbi:MAG: sugar kinase [Candidatus Lokiarchaeota archaeon]|nr:sugar kinase [Candidatus Lokiarchaeota archaeon]